MSRRTKASSESRSIFCASSPIRGMSISGLTGGCMQVALAGLGDVHRQVADPLQVGVDLHGRDDDAQVGGHRLMQGQQLEAAIVHFHVQVVDRLVAGQHGVERRVVAVHHPAHRFAHPLLGQPAHREQPLLERVEILLEMPKDPLH